MNNQPTYQVDVLIPTARRRLGNCLFQIRAVLSSNVAARVSVLMSGPWPELSEALSTEERSCVRLIETAPDGINVPDTLYHPDGFLGLPKVTWALDNLDLAPWFGYFSDDDALLPWGLDALMVHTDDVELVVGRALPVSRIHKLDFTPYTVGKTLDRCRVSNACAIYKTEALKSLPRPWFYHQYIYADWELINRMARHFRTRIIPNTISVVTLYDLEQLPERYRQLVVEHNQTEVSRDLKIEAKAFDPKLISCAGVLSC